MANRELVGLDLLAKLIQVAVLTGRIANKAAHRVSVLLISPPEHGKTSIIMRRKIKTLIPLNDLTGNGIDKIIQQFPQATHIGILDMLGPTSHKGNAVKHLMSRIAAVSEEGWSGSADPSGVTINRSPSVKGFIIAATPWMVSDKRLMWHRQGVCSRLLPIFFQHSAELTKRVKESILSDFKGSSNKKIEIVVPEFDIPDDYYYVPISDAQLGTIGQFEKQISERLGETGYRRIRHFCSLVCAHALLRTRQESKSYPAMKQPKVQDEDLQFLSQIMDYISYDQAREI